MSGKQKSEGSEASTSEPKPNPNASNPTSETGVSSDVTKRRKSIEDQWPEVVPPTAALRP